MFFKIKHKVNELNFIDKWLLQEWDNKNMNKTSYFILSFSVQNGLEQISPLRTNSWNMLCYGGASDLGYLLLKRI